MDAGGSGHSRRNFARRLGGPQAGYRRPVPDSERFKNEYLDATFSDTISIYLLSLYLDVDYYDLRERDYPLLAPSALAERLRKVAELFPPNTGFEFAVLYKRRG